LHPAGTINRYVIHAPFGQTSPTSLHTVSLNAVLALGSTTGLRLPEEVFIYTIEAIDIETFGAGCTERVQRAIPDVVSRLKADILSILPDASCVPCQGEGIRPFPPGPCTTTQVLKQR
jgi:Ni,Fe-hydrogenase maturation factor